MIKSMTEFAIGGLCYGLMETAWRGHSHISMFVAGGICFCLISMVGKRLSALGLMIQSIICSAMITAVEFSVGVVVNLWMGLNVWDYSTMSGNILGQICPQFTALWCVISVMAIYMRSIIGRYMLNEEPYPIRILPIAAKRKTAAN